MLTVTEGAKELLKDLLAPHRDDPDFGVRLILKPQRQFGLVTGRKSPGDYVVEHEGLTVLLVGHEVADRLAELTLDTRDTPEGSRLRLVPKE